MIRTKSLDYVGRYLARKEKFPEGVQTGKVWGRWNKKLFPIQWESVQVSLTEAYKVRRVFRRLQRKKGTSPLRKVQVFVPHEAVVKLLEFLKGEEHPKGARRPLPTWKPKLQRASVSKRKQENQKNGMQHAIRK